MTEPGDWVGYYDGQGEREPRDILLQVLERFDEEDRRGSAVDLGCGQGFESTELLRRGWEVLSIDAQDEAIRRVRRRIPPELAARSTTVVSPMEAAPIPSSDLIFASYSLPFCEPDAFPDLWARIGSALRPGGRFAGEIFGDRDTWAETEGNMTFFDIERARALFDGMELESFVEEESDDEGWDEIKHWHVFHVIARRPG